MICRCMETKQIYNKQTKPKQPINQIKPKQQQKQKITRSSPFAVSCKITAPVRLLLVKGSTVESLHIVVWSERKAWAKKHHDALR